MVFDQRCARCSAIKKVIYLRRKTVENGCHEDESNAAQTISDALVAKYGLTRGEVYDRTYAPPPTLQTYKEDVVWSTRKSKSKRGPIIDLDDVG